MGNVSAFHHGERGGHADPIVGAQCRAIRLQPVPLPYDLDGIFIKVMKRSLVLLADHVEVALQEGHRRFLASLVRRFANHKIADMVLRTFQSEFGGHTADKLPRGGLFCRAARNGRYFVKVLPNRSGSKFVSAGIMECSVILRRDFVVDLESGSIVHPSRSFAALRSKIHRESSG